LTRRYAEDQRRGEQYNHLTRREADQAGAEMLAEARTPTWPPWPRKKSTPPRPTSQIDEALQLMLIPKDLDDKRAAFVEIAPALATTIGAACDLFRLYTCLSRAQRWRIEIISESPSELGGYKEWCCALTAAGHSGRGRVRQTALESGGHRVQRVPATETRAASTPAYYRAGQSQTKPS
jgi:peptide chain release factor 1